MLTTNSFFFFSCNPPHLVRIMRHPKHTSHRLLFNGLPTSCSESTARCWGATFQTFQLLVWLSAFQNMRTYAAGRVHRRKFKAVPEGEKVAKKNMASLTKRFLRGFWPPPKTAPLPLVLFTTCWLLVGSFVSEQKKCIPCFLLGFFLILLSLVDMPCMQQSVSFYPNRIVIDHTQYSKVQYNKNP